MPTTDQLKTMQRYHRKPLSDFLSAHPSASSGEATDVEGIREAASKSLGALKWPIVVNWDEGLIAVGDVSEVQGMLEAMRAKRDGNNAPGGEKKWFGGLFGKS